MRNKLKILQITPGGIEIPPKSWGAVEKIIWNYKLNLEKMGHIVDIGFPLNITGEYDIIHCHMANQCIDLNKINKKYIFSFHDHHAYLYGKKSEVYKENLNAIKKSIISVTHAEYLTEYFDTDKLFFLQHGVDTNFYTHKNNFKSEHKLLCVAHNILLNDDNHDRKGFRLSIESAKELNLPITIVGPKNNRKFFDKNKDLLDYEKLNIIEDPNQEQLVNIYNNHTIFLNPSNLEAGHPNLTVLEAISCGLPTISTYNGKEKINGLIKCNLHKNDIINKIKYIIDNYDELKKESLDNIKDYDWYNISKKLEQIYYNIIDIKENFDNEKMKNKIIDIYNNSNFFYKEYKIPETKILVNFNDRPKVSISSFSGDDTPYKIEFIDNSNNSIIYTTTLKNGQWSKPNRQWYTDWLIKITNLNNDKTELVKFDLNYKDVFINIKDECSLDDISVWLGDIEKFSYKHNCEIYLLTKYKNLFSNIYKNIEFVDNNFDTNKVYTKYLLSYSDDININPIGNVGSDISKNVLKL